MPRYFRHHPVVQSCEGGNLLQVWTAKSWTDAGESRGKPGNDVTDGKASSLHLRRHLRSGRERRGDCFCVHVVMVTVSVYTCHTCSCTCRMMDRQLISFYRPYLYSNSGRIGILEAVDWFSVHSFCRETIPSIDHSLTEEKFPWI